jgi:hypothetical protein
MAMIQRNYIIPGHLRTSPFFMDYVHSLAVRPPTVLERHDARNWVLEGDAEDHRFIGWLLAQYGLTPWGSAR